MKVGMTMTFLNEMAYDYNLYIFVTIDVIRSKKATFASISGQVKKTLSGFSQTSTLPHTGIIYYCEIVQDLPPDIRRKVNHDKIPPRSIIISSFP